MSGVRSLRAVVVGALVLLAACTGDAGPLDGEGDAGLLRPADAGSDGGATGGGSAGGTGGGDSGGGGGGSSGGGGSGGGAAGGAGGGAGGGGGSVGTPDAGLPALGPKRILAAHLKFSDTVGTPFPTSATTTRATTITAFFSEISNGLSTQQWDVKPWATLPNTRASYEADASGEALRQAAAQFVAATYDLSQVDLIVIFLAPLSQGTPSCFTSTQTLDARTVTRAFPVVQISRPDITGEDGCLHASLISHEVGHGYGFLHSSQFACTTWPKGLAPSLVDPTFHTAECGFFPGRMEATFFPYGSYDFMGGYRGHPAAYWKRLAGWISPGQVVERTADGTELLEPLETSSSGAKAVRVPLGADQAGSPVAYWLEYRSRRPVDLENAATLLVGEPDRVRVWMNLANVPPENVQAGRSYIEQSKLFAFWGGSDGLDKSPLAVGESWNDPHRGVRFTRGANVGSGATAQASITVTVSRLSLDPPLVVTVRGGLTQSVVVTNRGTAAVTQTAPTLGGRHATAFQVTQDGCSGQALQPNASCSLTVSHTRSAGDAARKFATLQWTSTDAVRTTPSVGLVGLP